MKIYSWNMFVHNADADAAIAYIAQLHFDVLCLQEVPESVCERLKQLPYHTAESTDARFDGRDEHSRIVILTPHEIRASERFALPALRRTVRSRVFIRFMHLWGWRYVEGREGVWADIALPGSDEVRIFNLHLSLSYPESRHREFELALAQADAARPMVICGDFNVVESWRVTLLNWLQGGRLGDIFYKHRERRAFEARIKALGLANPLRGVQTQAIARSQLDHILIPHNWIVEQATVIADRHGSDHNPIRVEANITK